jgi:type I restriction enzyme, S subunit
MIKLPQGWRQVSLGEVCEVIQGQSPPGSTYNTVRKGLPFFQGKADFGPTFPTPRKWCTHPKKIAEPGDVLISVRAPVGPTNLCHETSAIGRGLAAIRPPEEMPTKYLLYALRATADRLSSRATGSTFEAVTGAVLKQHEIPLAPISQQMMIVDEIEKQFTRIDAAFPSLFHAQERLWPLRSSVITSLVEGQWPKRGWGEIGQSQNGRAFPSKDYSDDGIKLLRPGNLHRSGRVEWTSANTRWLPMSYRESHPKYLVGPGELVMNLTAQSLKDEFLGRICLTGPGDLCLLNQRLARVTPPDFLDAKYLLFVLKSGRFRRFVRSLNKGSLIQHIFTSQLDEYEVPIPPLEEQQEIVSEIEGRLSSVDVTESALMASQVRAQTLRRAILSRAFAGELTTGAAA